MDNFVISDAPLTSGLEFPLEEYKMRLRRAQEEMKKHGLPLLLLHQPENILYLSGFYTSTGFFSYHALAVPSEGDPVLIVRDMEVPAAEALSWVRTFTVYSDAADPVPVWLDAARRAVEGMGLENGKIGVDEHSWFLTVERWKKMVDCIMKLDT